MNLIITLAPWSDHAAAFLARAQRRATAGDVSHLRQAIEEGRADLLAIQSGPDAMPCLYVVLMRDADALRVAAAAGALPGVDLTRTVLPWIEAMARRAYNRVVIQTARPGLLRILASMGYDNPRRVGHQHLEVEKALA